MQARPLFLFAAAIVPLLAGCSAAVGTSPMVDVPKDSPQRCAKICSDMGTALSSVVVMASTVGCVCTPVTARGAGTDISSAPAAGGMAAILVQEEEQRRQGGSQPSQPPR